MGLTDLERGTYLHHFACVPAAAPVVPVFVRKPNAQSALVVGLAGETLTTDRDRRVKVEFAWQRGLQPNAGGLAHGSAGEGSAGEVAAVDAKGNAPGNEQSGTWVRVPQPAAGANWGSVYTPGIGTEVAIGAGQLKPLDTDREITNSARGQSLLPPRSPACLMNLDTLLAPISEASPCGADLSFSNEFDSIQESRRADDPTLDQGEWVTALKLADWPGVLEQCEKVLDSSKDLRVAAWFTEANARLSGYAGLAEGLDLCRLLCERFWAELHPRLEDDGDAEQRSGNLRWLLTQVEALAPQLPVLRHGTRTFSLRDIETAHTSARSNERSDDSASASSSSITPDDIAAARRGTSREFFASNLIDAKRAQQALVQLQTVIDEHLGEDGPGFSGAKSALEKAVHAIGIMAREANPGSGSAAPQSIEAGSTATAFAKTTGAASGLLSSRADALRQLRAVAEFFRRTEPHSPVAYLADRAAQWGDMPLHQWLRAVVKDQSALSHMEELLGVEAPPPREE